ncbi:MAG TPA: EI24 domain-containing protein [Kouleothrix sp.]|uniref:EI24 domain-containing protein n=1 Tax=Kouleothrix sp. TaxID=2779161 RepID=UPI002CD9B3BD|nr:EI24 domain-containing protein [Kouleothrix sp.]
MIQALISGFAYPLRALALLRRTPRLWRYVLVPIVVNLLVGATLYATLLFAGLRAIDGMVVGLPAWAAAFGALLRLLLLAGLLVGTAFVLVRFGVVLGAPWYARMSDQIELARRGVLPAADDGAGAALRDLGRALAFELKKLLLVLPIGAALLLLSFVPVAGQILATAGGIALGATIACLDFLDYPLERRRLSFRAKLGAIRRHLPATAGFGLVALGLVSIPLINLLAIPLCVAAGTLLFCDAMHELR